MEFRPRSAKEALTHASSYSDPNAEPLSEASYFHTVVQSLETVFDTLDQLPQKHRESVEQFIDISFHAGSHFRIALTRRKHLADIKREVGNAKGRSRGGDARARNYDEENRLLFEFMDEKLRTKTRYVKTAANWAVKQNLGAQKGSVEQRTEANRQRYLNRQKRRNRTKM